MFLVKMEYANKEKGIKAENYFISCLNDIGIPYLYEDSWFDFEVLGQKVEVKSCTFSVKNTGRCNYRAGRFDFTDEDNREKQYKSNVWVCFILRYKEQFILLGFCRAKQLEKKRYISIHKIRDLDLIDLNDWIKKYN